MWANKDSKVLNNSAETTGEKNDATSIFPANFYTIIHCLRLLQNT